MNKEEYAKMESILKGISIVEKNQKYGVIKGSIEIIPSEYDKIVVDGFCIELFKGGRISVLDIYGDKITIWSDCDYIEKVNNRLFKIAKESIDSQKNNYKEWSILIIDSDGISDVGWYKAVSVKNDEYLLLCTEIPIDEIYSEERLEELGYYDIKDEDFNFDDDEDDDFVDDDYLNDEDDEFEWYHWVKENNHCSDFGYWEIETIEGDDIGNVEGFEWQAEELLDCYLSSDSSDDNSSRQVGIGRHYGGYNGWDDDSIDETFEGDPELTWNVD